MPKESYKLRNAEEYAQGRPTFDLPSRRSREGVPLGADVKVIFEAESPVVGGPFDGATAERMWINVRERTAEGRYVGALNNVPVVVRGLELHQRIDFGPEHIIDIDDGIARDQVVLVRGR